MIFVIGVLVGVALIAFAIGFENPIDELAGCVVSGLLGALAAVTLWAAYNIAHWVVWILWKTS